MLPSSTSAYTCTCAISTQSLTHPQSRVHIRSLPTLLPRAHRDPSVQAIRTLSFKIGLARCPSRSGAVRRRRSRGRTDLFVASWTSTRSPHATTCIMVHGSWVVKRTILIAGWSQVRGFRVVGMGEIHVHVIRPRGDKRVSTCTYDEEIIQTGRFGMYMYICSLPLCRTDTCKDHASSRDVG